MKTVSVLCEVKLHEPDDKKFHVCWLASPEFSCTPTQPGSRVHSSNACARLEMTMPYAARGSHEYKSSPRKATWRELPSPTSEDGTILSPTAQ
jgi:hypothetical protein